MSRQAVPPTQTFEGKTAIVAGADLPAGRTIAQRLARAGAHVVAVGTDETALMQLAHTAPQAIETLALRRGTAAVIETLGAAWGEEELHVYIDVMPLEPDEGDRPGARIARSAGLASALLPGVRAGRAQAVIVVPRPAPDSERDPARGFDSLVRQLSRDCAPGRVFGLSVPMDVDGCGEALADAVLRLSGVPRTEPGGGRILDWRPDAHAGPEG